MLYFSTEDQQNEKIPWWLSGKESACQSRKRGFNPWVRKIPWRREWKPNLVFLPGKSHGQRSLAGLWSIVSQRVGLDLVIEQQWWRYGAAGERWLLSPFFVTQDMLCLLIENSQDTCKITLVSGVPEDKFTENLIFNGHIAESRLHAISANHRSIHFSIN